MLRAKISLILNYFIVSVLLNSVGVFVLMLSTQYHANQATLSYFAPLKDFSIIVASFVLASVIPRMGPRLSTYIGLILILLACLGMGLLPSTRMSFVFFALLGTSFALIKVATYASVIYVVKDSHGHASFVSLLESFFMGGVLSMFWIFGRFMALGHWTYTFLVFGALTVCSGVLFASSPFDASSGMVEEQRNDDRGSGQRETLRSYLFLLARFVTWLFMIIAVCYVFIENGLNIWLPSFNHEFLRITSSKATELVSIFAGSLALGRFIFAFVLKKFDWRLVMTVCLILGVLLLALIYGLMLGVTIPDHEITSWTEVPMVAWLLPLLGFVIAPLYPTFCSKLLTAFPQARYQGALSSLIVIFSAVGGMAGAAALGWLMKFLGGEKGVLVPVLPLVIMLLLLGPFGMAVKRRLAEGKLQRG